jgi:hypothetical protein
MAIVGLSEFTFGFGFLYEQTTANWGELKAAPILPSLQQEQDVGWDARLPLQGTDYYYQFKLTDYLERRNAKHIQDGTYDGAYYRFHLHKKNNNRQHQRLREHCTENPFTYYVAPEFNTLDSFNSSFVAKELRERSRLIALADCDDIADGQQHYITFRANDPGFTQHSSPKRHEQTAFGRNLPEVYRSSHQHWAAIDKPFAERLFEKTRDTVTRNLAREERFRIRREVKLLEDFVPQQASRREILLRAADVLSTFLGVTLVIVGTSQ